MERYQNCIKIIKNWQLKYEIYYKCNINIKEIIK